MVEGEVEQYTKISMVVYVKQQATNNKQQTTSN